ncbi:MAG: 50S ribosomal protein L22, partial [Chloroflexota bacterium]|nr:50S ribosomal protein L22 [Chloroflexota bacterium]
TASLKSVRVSPRKARLVVDAVRGKRVSEAIAIARFLPQKTAADLERLLKSVAANAENNYDLDPEDLWIKSIYADDGPTLKRFQPRARGRVGPILKRSCSITVVAEDRETR